jgi:hypothetical protein
MGTRGAVAVRTGPKSWVGVFNHFDSYPTGLGEQVYKEVKKTSLKALAEEILKVGDWREYLSGGICEYCGKKAGQPHTIEGTIFGYSNAEADYGGGREQKLKAKNVEELTEVLKTTFGGAHAEMAPLNAHRQWPIVQNMQKCGYPDPDCLYHQHGQGKADQLTDKTADALYIEWVYVLDSKKDLIEVWAARVAEGKVRKSGTEDYEHFKVTEVPVDDHEPDWKAIQKKASKMKGYEDE